MTPEMLKVFVFYSWQNDLSDLTNRGAIRKALKVASATVEDEISRIDIIIDEAIREMAGSENMPQKILESVQDHVQF